MCIAEWLGVLYRTMPDSDVGNLSSRGRRHGCGHGGLIAGVDASRNRSGGAIRHLRGIVEDGHPARHGIERVHVWAHDDLLDCLPARPWLTLHRVNETRGSLRSQLWWQYARLPRIARDLGIDVLFNTDAGSVCPFANAVTLSQDMLSFEPREIRRYSLGSRARLRLELLRYVQLGRLRRSSLAIFLSDHARKVIGQRTPLPRALVIPHGVDASFRAVAQGRREWPMTGTVRCLYVSNAAPYKHQWHVVEAVAQLRRITGRDVRLRLVGGGRGTSLKRLLEAVSRFDPHREFVDLVDFVPHEAIPGELLAADLFVFASSCENLPITLLEAMASGIAICSSDRGPMPEVLGPDASYFDPEVPETIAKAIRLMIEDAGRREEYRATSLARSGRYLWRDCADKTWAALASVARGNALRTQPLMGGELKR